MIERVYYRVKLDANTFIYTPYLSNIPTSITDIPTNVTYDTTDGITLKTKETWRYDNNESSLVTTEREIPLKAGDGVTIDVSEDGKYVVMKVDPSGLIDDVQINGQSIVENKVANIVVDTESNGRSSNPVANSLFTTKTLGLGNTIFNHVNNKNNPHAVTKAQVGLGDVNNTSDANKPVSTAQKAALDKKIDKAGGTFSGNVAIQGDLTVSGTTTTESEQQLAVKENVIVTNADKANLQALLSGLAINKNSTATYGIMYDPADDTVKFGEGTLDANRKFVFKTGEGHPLAIRADSSQFTDAVLVKWNATTKAFEPASGTWQNLLDKIEITDIDLTLGDETVLYDTTNGIQLSATGKITRKDGTSEQPQVDLDIPIVPGNGITIDKVANKEQVSIKVDASVVALKSDLTPYAKTVDVVAKSQIGAANGVASLGADGKVPAAQLSGGGSGGSIDADTLNGLLKAGDGISIDKKADEEKVEIKIDSSKVISAIGFTTYDSMGNQSYLYPDNIQYWDYEGNQYTLAFPLENGILTTDGSFKTLFGNKNIVGSGNIDLYQHNIKFSASSAGVFIFFTIISSNNIVVDSLTDLKTLLGNTFEYPCSGADENNNAIVLVKDNGYCTVSDIAKGEFTYYPAGTWTDTVTTI